MARKKYMHTLDLSVLTGLNQFFSSLSERTNGKRSEFHIACFVRTNYVLFGPTEN